MHIKFVRNLLIIVCIFMYIISAYRSTSLTSSYSLLVNTNVNNNNTNYIAVVNNTPAATAVVPPVGTAYKKDNNNNSDEIVNNNKPFIPAIPVYNNSNNLNASNNNNNNNYTPLMSYYPISMYPSNSRNGLYEYPYRESNNNINNNNLIKESSMEQYSSLPHPSCIAMDLIRSFLHEHSDNNVMCRNLSDKCDKNNNISNNKNNLINNNYISQDVINDVNQWFRPIRGLQCLKPVYGEQYKSNNYNNNNNFDEDDKKYNSPFSHIMLRNIIYFKGEFYYVTPPQKQKYNNTNNNNNKTKKEVNDYISFSYGGDFTSFDMVKPFHLIGDFTLRRLNKEHLYQINNKNNNSEKGNNNNSRLSIQTAVAELMHLLRRKGLDKHQESTNNNNINNKDKSIVSNKNSTNSNHNSTNNENRINNNNNNNTPLHLHVPLAYWQPPTDYNSQYHTMAEIIMPALHTLIRIVKESDIPSELYYNNNISSNNNSNNGNGLLLPPVLLITSRVRGIPHYDKTSKVKGAVLERCHEVPNTYENPDLISPIINNNNNKNCMNTPLGRMMQAVVGTAGVYGLQPHHAQTYLSSNILRGHLYRIWEIKIKKDNYKNNNNDDIFFIDRLLVGGTTHCQSIRFSDAYYAEAVAQDQFLRGMGNTSRINLRRGNNNNNNSSPEDILRNKRLTQFFDVYRECQLFLWEYRNFFLNKISSGLVYNNNMNSNYYNKRGHNNPIIGDVNRNQTRTCANRHQTGAQINNNNKHIIKKEPCESHILRRETSLMNRGQSDESLKNDCSLNDNSNTLSLCNNNNNSSYTSPSAKHKDIRMLPIIPPVYSDSVTPVYINNNTSNNNISKYGDGIHIVIASRKGDWAREYNEEEIASNIRTHLKGKAHDLIVKIQKSEKSLDNINNLNNDNTNSKSQYQAQINYLSIAKQAIYATATVRIVKFSGKKGLQHKLLHQLAVPKTTILIGNHGANLTPSIFLRPNSGVITLSFSNPGFYPYTVFPRWLHWRDIVINQKCNRRRNKKMCKLSNFANYNDMVATGAQIVKILEYIEEIIAEQIKRPRGLKDVNI